MTEPLGRIQAQRFELKYLVDEVRARQVRDFLRPHLEPDPFGATQPDLSYPVHSIYLDSPDLHLHHSTINGNRNRFKMRVRFYENGKDSPVFFEIKRREDNAILKERCPVKPTQVAEIVAGRPPRRDDLLHDHPRDERTLQRFCSHISRLAARPISQISYRREAWHGIGDTRIRATFDRDVRSCPVDAVTLKPPAEPGLPVFGSSVVLELKFTSRFPRWMAEMVRAFNLRQCPAGKYVDGILVTEEARGPVARPMQPVTSHHSRQRMKRRERATADFTSLNLQRLRTS